MLDAGQDLRAAVSTGAGVASATERLAVALESSMITLDGTAQGFTPSPSGPPPAPEVVEDVLAAAVGQLTVADVALSAGRTVGEDVSAAEASRGEAAASGAIRDGTSAHLDSAAALDAALTRADTAVAAVSSPPGGDRFGFAPAAGLSQDPASVVALVRERTAAALTTIATSTADVFTQAVTALRDHGPEVLQTAWSRLSEKLNLGGIGGRLIRLGLRALEAALDALHRLVPMPALLAVRDQIRTLGETLKSDTPAVEVARWALSVEATAVAVEADLARDELQAGRLALAAASLDDLAARCERLMRLAAGASVAVVGVGAVTGFLHVAIPHFAIVLATAQLLVLGTALVLGRDFVDSASGIGWVRGVRVVVRSAVEPA